MKVLVIPSWYTTYNAPVLTRGVFHYEQSVALKEYCDVALYYPYDDELRAGFIKNDERGLMTYRRGNKMHRLRHILYVIDMFRIVRDFHPDIIQAHVGIQGGRLAILLGKIFRIPVTITEHNPLELMNLDNPKNKRITGKAFHSSKANICVSIDSMDKMKREFPSENFRLIYNGIINPNEATFDNQEYAVSGYVNCCIVAAFYSKDIKGYQYLLPSVKNLVDKGYKIKLHICGGGDYFEYYRNMASELGISDSCIFYGSCDRNKVYSIVSQMDFNISASIFECSGVSVQEAMLLGKPLVVTKSGGANSLVTDFSAIVVEKESVNALVDGIAQMIQRLKEFDSDRIKNYAFDNFEIDHTTRKYVGLFEEVLGGKSS